MKYAMKIEYIGPNKRIVVLSVLNPFAQVHVTDIFNSIGAKNSISKTIR